MSTLLSSTILDDLKLALRQMRRSPGFSITAILVLALGIAANVIVFGVIQAIILQPINVPHPERVKTFSNHEHGYPAYSFPEVRDVRNNSTVFSAVAAEAMDIYAIDANGVTEPLWGEGVSGQYFDVVGIHPAIGRLLTPADDDHPGASEAAVLSWPTWKGQFGSDPNIVGKTIRVNKQPYTIVGVTQEGFNGTWKFLQPNIFVPMANSTSLDGENWLEDRLKKHVFPIVRLKDGVTEEQAQAEMTTIAKRIARQNPKEEDGLGLWLAPPGLAGDFILGPAKRFMAGLLVLAGIVLLACCANLGGLFAARTADRTREIAIRLAVGSSRWRIVRQVLVEAFLISVLGGAGACVLSWMALNALARWHPPTDYPIKFLVAPRPSLYVIAFVISLFAGIVFGVMPLGQIFKADPNDAIKSGTAQASGRRWAMRDFLLAAQIALCCVTVTAAFVSLRGLNKSLNMNLGINPQHAVLAKFDVQPAGYTGDSIELFQRQLLNKVQHLPGVKAAAYADTTPLGDTDTTRIFMQQTTDFRPSNKAFEADEYNVSPGYFAAAETPILEGRGILSTDTLKSPLVAVVSRQFALDLFHNEHVVGRYFKNETGKPVQVVGIAAEGKYFLPSEDPDEAVFYSLLQKPSAAVSMLVRTQPGVSTADMTDAVRKTIRDADPAIPIRSAGPWVAMLSFSFFPGEVATVCLGLFGAFGLLLSITGTFGLASYTVSKRMRELSIRVALGAQGKQILSAALGRMLKLLATGSAIGLLLGVLTGKVLSHVVYQATAQDPVVLGAVALTILLTGMLSVAGPVRRALHADPANLLREQ